MSNRVSITEAWKGFLETLTPQEIESLKASGFKIDDIHDDGVPEPHRRIYLDSYADRMAAKPEESDDSRLSSLVSIIARVINAYDCTSNRAVLLHNDCFRIALGYKNYKSMADLAAKYGVDKATVSWRVKQIQKSLNLPPSCYMRSESDCQNIKQGVIKSNQKKNERKTSRHR
jgi:hypothetical protein